MRKGSIAIRWRLITGAVAVAACVSLSACGFSDAPVELAFVASFTERTLIDGGVEGDSPGDYIPGSGDLLNEKGEVIGEFNVVSFATAISEAGQGRVMLSEYAFDGGVDSIVIAGAGRSPAGEEPLRDRTYTYPVVGGTGSYAGARGECNVTRMGEAYEVKCRLSVMPG